MNDQPIRILLVCESFTGGCKRHILDLLKAAEDETAFHVTFAYSDLRQRGCWTDIPLRSNLEKVLIRMVRRPAPLLDLIAFIQLFLLIKNGSFDIVHLHSSKAGLVGRLAARAARFFSVRPRILYSPHGLSAQVGGLAGRIFMAAEKKLARVTDRFVAVSDGEKKLLMDTGLASDDSITTVSNGIDSEEYRYIRPTEYARQKKAFTIGMIGRLVRQKGARYFVEAARTIAERHSGLRFLVVGEGPQKWYLQGLTPRSVCHIEFQCSRGIKDFLSRVDIVVVPSLWEGLPYVLLEAMAASKPVIASDIPGISGTLGECGVLVPSHDSSAITDAACRLVEDTEEMARLGELARKRAETSFSLERFVNEIRSLYIEEHMLLVSAQQAPQETASP